MIAIVAIVFCCKKHKAKKSVLQVNTTQVRPLPTSTEMTDMGVNGGDTSSPDKNLSALGPQSHIMATDVEATGEDRADDSGRMGGKLRSKSKLSDSSSQPSINMRL